jgi:hypothetical protein
MADQKAKVVLSLLHGKALALYTTHIAHIVFDKHENSNKENPKNRDLGCIYTIEY